MGDPLLKLDSLAKETRKIFKERNAVIDSYFLSLLTGNHMFLLGEPGTAKTAIVNFVSNSIDGAEYFYWLMTKYTIPEEVFGGPDVGEFMQGRYKRVTDHKLPVAHFAFIDEIFKSSSSILNCLLSIMNEKFFFDATSVISVPLISLVGASNEIPSDTELNALYDRFLIRHYVERVKDRRSRKAVVMNDLPDRASTCINLNDVMEARGLFEAAIPKMTFDIDFYLDLHKLLIDKHGIIISDRRLKKCAKLVLANAFLDGRDATTSEDFGVLKNCFWTEPSQIPIVSKAVNEIVNPLGQRAVELLDEATEIFQNCMKLAGESDKKGAIQYGVEANAKLKDILETIEKEINGSNGASTLELGIAKDKIRGEMVTKIVTEVLGASL